MSRRCRLLLYGDVNLNILDGSAIWLTSLAETLVLAGADVHVQLKAPDERKLLTGPLRDSEGTTVHAPPTARPMGQSAAVDQLAKLDGQHTYDAIVLRGYKVAGFAARDERLAGRLWSYLTDIPQRWGDVTEVVKEELATIAAASDLLLCQTEELREYLESLLPPSLRRTALLPPMVPQLFHEPEDRPLGRPARNLLYAGKFAPAWGFLELASAVAEIRQELPDLKLHVAGDKIHDPPDDPAFAAAVRERLSLGDGVVWHGGIPRGEVAALLRRVDVATSARDRSMSDSLELSTKVLEYGASGVPVVLNRTSMHERILGRDYPLFIDDLDELPRVIAAVTADSTVLELARQRASHASQPFRIDQVAECLQPYLTRLVPRVEAPTPAPRVVVAGHDLKFIRPYLPWLERSGATVRLDEWTGHERHDVDASEEAVRWADIVVAEWCLGNAAWYSEHCRKGQRVVVRLHRQELETPYPHQLQEGSVANYIVVSDSIGQQVCDRFGWPSDRVRIVPNSVDVLALARAKLPGADFTLGLLGYLPKLKRLDRALDLLELLLRKDPRWRLRVAGSLPFESPWVWGRLEERAYFTRQLDRIRSSPRLRRAVSLDGTVHPPSWFRQIGTILSPSDLESFHLAVAEGMASGAKPAIWSRDGASDLFSHRWIGQDTGSVAEVVLASAKDPQAEAAARDEVASRYTLDDVAERFASIVLGAEQQER